MSVALACVSAGCLAGVWWWRESAPHTPLPGYRGAGEVRARARALFIRPIISYLDNDIKKRLLEVNGILHCTLVKALDLMMDTSTKRKK